jgi:hypothetical protein
MSTTSNLNTFSTDVGVGNGNITDSHWAWEPPKTYDHPIQGQMFMVGYQASDYMMSTMSDVAVKNRIKEDIALSLAKKMLEENVIEFTQIPDINTGITTIKARCFLVPDDRVRLLRTLYKMKEI